jgi:hypothetical protein
VLIRFLQVDTKHTSAMYWEAALPVFEILTKARTVVLLHAVADNIQPLEASRKIFETSGSKLSELRAEVVVLKEKLQTLSAAGSLQSFRCKHVQQLMSVFRDPSTAGHGQKVFSHWPEHAWTIKLQADSVPTGITLQLKDPLLWSHYRLALSRKLHALRLHVPWLVSYPSILAECL